MNRKPSAAAMLRASRCATKPLQLKKKGIEKLLQPVWLERRDVFFVWGGRGGPKEGHTDREENRARGREEEGERD